MGLLLDRGHKELNELGFCGGGVRRQFFGESGTRLQWASCRGRSTAMISRVSYAIGTPPVFSRRINSVAAKILKKSEFMQCQQCDKQAMFHITELETGDVREIHLCEDHARVYLNQAEADGDSTDPDSPGALGVAQTAEELSELDQKVCDMCGITFFEFRNQGRLGCPHDYVQFEQELEPLIANIHGAVEHVGKRPSRTARDRGEEPLPTATESLTGVIGLRKAINEAVEHEDYERAGTLRDKIQRLLEMWRASTESADEATPDQSGGSSPDPA